MLEEGGLYVSNENWFVKRFEYEHGRRVLDEHRIKLLAAGMEREQSRA